MTNFIIGVLLGFCAAWVIKPERSYVRVPVVHTGSELTEDGEAVGTVLPAETSTTTTTIHFGTVSGGSGGDGSSYK